MLNNNFVVIVTLNTKYIFLLFSLLLVTWFKQIVESLKRLKSFWRRLSARLTVFLWQVIQEVKSLHLTERKQIW